VRQRLRSISRLVAAGRSLAISRRLRRGTLRFLIVSRHGALETQPAQPRDLRLDSTRPGRARPSALFCRASGVSGGLGALFRPTVGCSASRAGPSRPTAGTVDPPEPAAELAGARRIPAGVEGDHSAADACPRRSHAPRPARRRYGDTVVIAIGAGAIAAAAGWSRRTDQHDAEHAFAAASGTTPASAQLAAAPRSRRRRRRCT